MLSFVKVSNTYSDETFLGTGRARLFSRSAIFSILIFLLFFLNHGIYPVHMRVLNVNSFSYKENFYETYKSILFSYLCPVCVCVCV